MVDQTEQSVFQNNSETTQQTQDEATAAPQQEPSETNQAFADLLTSIKAEDGRQKYNDVATALTSIPHAQQHIKQLEVEMAEMKDELTRRKTAEELLESLKATDPKSGQPPQSGLDVSQLDSLLEAKLQAKEQASRAKENVNKVIGAMTTQFGAKAEDVFVQVARDSGLTVEAMNGLAASSPEAVLKLVGASTKALGTTALTTGSVNTENMQPSTQTASPKVNMWGAPTSEVKNAWRAAKPT